MLGNTSVLHIVRAGSDITFSSLKVIGNRILDAFHGSIKEFQLTRHKAPVVDRIDAYFLTKILHQESNISHRLINLFPIHPPKNIKFLSIIYCYSPQNNITLRILNGL